MSQYGCGGVNATSVPPLSDPVPDSVPVAVSVPVPVPLAQPAAYEEDEEVRFRETKYVEMNAKVEKFERFIATRQELTDEWLAFNK